ncbi:MAG: DUF4062 domain-containing protein [Planctomycetota bacterium]
MKPRIFISAVTTEFGRTRQLVANVLLRLGYDPVTQDIFGTESGDLRQMLREKIDDCDGLIQLVGRAYGAEPPTVGAEFATDGFTRVSYTQFEFLYARAKEKKSNGQFKTWLIFADEGCTLDHPLEELDLPRDSTHPNPVGYQSERRALQEAWRQRWKQGGHLHHAASSNTDLELKVERLKDEFAELRRRFRSWQQRMTRVLVACAVLAVIVLGVVGSIRWQQQREHNRAETARMAQEAEQLAQQQERDRQQQERDRQDREREKQEKERLAAEAARQQAQQIVEVQQEFADRFLLQLITNKEISPDEARQRALKELPALVKLPMEEIQALIDRKLPASTAAAPISPLDRARAALAQGKLDDVLQVADEQRQEGRELAMLEGTAALAKFRKFPKPEWNERALAAFRRALALSDRTQEPKAWTDAATAAASLLHNLARYSEAEPLLVEALAILEQKHGHDSQEVAVVLNNLALVFLHSNRQA